MLNRSNLYAYQNRAVEFIKQNPACALWIDMGLGKTASTLTAFSDMMNSFDARRAIVFAPLRVARKVWADEIETWAHLQGLTTAKIIGTPEQRIAALKTPADIHLINREQTQWLEELFIQGKKQIRRWPWDTIILDESQSYKHQSAKRWKSMRRLRKLGERMIHLTGTPSPNGYQDLWGQAYLLDKGQRLGITETAFRDRWFDPPGWEQFNWKIKPHAAKEIQDALSDIVLSMRAEDYLDLPPVKNNFIRVSMSPEVKAKYERLERTFLLELSGNRMVTAANAGVVANKLLQLANGAVYYDKKGSYEVLHDEKIAALFETLEFLPEPVIIAYGFRSDPTRILEAMPKFCGKQKTFRVLKTDADFDAFRMGFIDYGIIHPASAGHGLNDLHLSGSENIVWFGLTNNLEFYDQLNARLTGGHRRMGKNIVIHHILTDGTVDLDMIALLGKKGADQSDLTAAMAAYRHKVLH